MSRFSVLILPFLVGCGSLDQTTFKGKAEVPHVVGVMPLLPDDANVRMIAFQFYSDAEALKKNTAQDVKSISFVTKFADKTGEGDSTVGECISYSDSKGTVIYKELQLLQPYWDSATPQTRMTLLYHELGHCALNLDHVPLDSGAIMEPVVLADEFADPNWFDLVKAEFSSSSLGLVDSVDDGCVVHITL